MIFEHQVLASHFNYTINTSFAFFFFFFAFSRSSAFDKTVNSNVLSDLRGAEIADAENAAFGFQGTFPH